MPCALHPAAEEAYKDYRRKTTFQLLMAAGPDGNRLEPVALVGIFTTVRPRSAIQQANAHRCLTAGTVPTDASRIPRLRVCKLVRCEESGELVLKAGMSHS